MLKNILTKNGRALLCIAFSFLLSNASLGATKAYRSWTSEEDQVLINGVRIHGAGNWAAIAEQLPGRTGQSMPTALDQEIGSSY
jgi:hypothetical protein